MSDQARDMMAKIERGVRLESAAEMTGEYRENLIHLHWCAGIKSVKLNSEFVCRRLRLIKKSLCDRIGWVHQVKFGL